MEEKRDRLQIFRYNAILSILFFFLSTFYIGTQIKNFDPARFTISQMSRFLTPEKLSYFNAIFFIKSFMDLSFTFFVFKFFKLKLYFPISLIWLVAVLSFGLLGFFPTHLYHNIHLSIVIVMFFTWTLSEHLFANLTKNEGFIYFTNNLIFIQMVIIFFFVVTKNFNAIFESIYLFAVFIWIIIFIGKFLRK